MKKIRNNFYEIGNSILKVKKSSKGELDRIMRETGMVAGGFPLNTNAIVKIMNALDAKGIAYYIGR